MLIQLIMNGAVFGALIGVMALGFSIQYNGCRFFAFTFGAAYTVSAYATFAFSRSLPFAIASIIGAMSGVLYALVAEVVVYQRIRTRGGTPLVLMIASIGLYTATQNVISLAFGDDTQFVRQWPVSAGIPVFGGRLSSAQVVSLFVSVGCITATLLMLKYTGLGKQLRAVADDAELAVVAGIDTVRCRRVATGLAALLAGTAAILVSLDVDLIPTMGFEALLLAIVACIVGGTNSFRGAVAGGMVVGVARSVGVWQLSSEWRDAIVFALLMAVLLVRPHGICGTQAGGLRK